MVNAGDDVKVLYRLDGFGPRNDLQKGIGYLSDQPLQGFTPRTFYVHDRDPKAIARANAQSSFGRFGHAIELNLNAGGSIWRWCFGGPADDPIYDISSTNSATTRIDVTRDHNLAVGDWIILTKGPDQAPGLWDKMYEVVAIPNARAFTINYQNIARMQTLTGPYAVTGATGFTETTEIVIARPTNNSTIGALGKKSIGTNFLLQFTQALTGVASVVTNFSYTGTITAMSATTITFTIPQAAPGESLISGGIFYINFAPIGVVNGGREISNRNQGFGRQIQNAMFFRTAGETYSFGSVRVSTAALPNTMVALDRPHGLAHNDLTQVLVRGDTGSVPLNSVTLGDKVWKADHMPTFVVTAITKANPAVVTVTGDIAPYLGKRIGERFGVRLEGIAGGSIPVSPVYFTATLLTSGATSTFSIDASTSAATGTYTFTGAIARITSDRCLLPGSTIATVWTPTDTTGSTGHTIGSVQFSGRCNPTMAGGAWGGPYEDGLGPLPGEDMGSPLLSATGKDSGNSFVIEAWCYPFEFIFNGTYSANEGSTHYGESNRPVLYPWMRMGFRLTLNYDGLIGLHQWKTMLDLDRDIDLGLEFTQLHSPFLGLRYGLGAAPGVEPKAYAMNVVRPDLGTAGLTLLTGVNIPASSPTIQYDGNLSSYEMDSHVISIAGADAQAPLSAAGPPPSNPLYRREVTIAVSSYSSANGKLTLTLASAHGFAVGFKFALLLSGVTGSPDINYLHLATATGTATLTIEQAAPAANFVGGTATATLAAGGLIWATGEATADFAIGLYAIRTVTDDPDSPLKRGVGTWFFGRNKFTNTNDPESSDLLVLGCNSGSNNWRRGRHEINTYITMYRELTADAALTCATAMSLAYQRGYS